MKLNVNYVFGIFLLLAGCTNSAIKEESFTPEEQVISVVTAYELALKLYDSSETIKFLHPECIEKQYGSEAGYHSFMKKAFGAIQRDGGIESLSKGKVWVSNNVAYVESVIKTAKAQQKGVLELKQLNGKWLISKLP